MGKIHKTIRRMLRSKRYEFRLIEGYERRVNELMEDMQNDGWELAGEVSAKYFDRGYSCRLVVPLKRKI